MKISAIATTSRVAIQGAPRRSVTRDRISGRSCQNSNENVTYTDGSHYEKQEVVPQECTQANEHVAHYIRGKDAPKNDIDPLVGSGSDSKPAQGQRHY